jgi:hypothetical protein
MIQPFHQHPASGKNSRNGSLRQREMGAAGESETPSVFFDAGTESSSTHSIRFARTTEGNVESISV